MMLAVEVNELARSLRWIAPHAGDTAFTATSPLLTGPARFPVLGTAQLYCDVFSRYRPHRRIPQPLARQMREQTLSTMWLSVPNKHTDDIFCASGDAGSSRVRQVLDLIASESRAEYTVPELARGRHRRTGTGAFIPKGTWRDTAAVPAADAPGTGPRRAPQP
jgi:hypothetical protein